MLHAIGMNNSVLIRVGERTGRDDPFDYEAALLACARGDRAALRDIYDREASRLLGVAARILRRRDLADEVLHDAFMQIWQKAGSFDPARGSGRTWIYSVVRHRAINALRRSGRETGADDSVFADIADPAEGPLDALSRLRDAAALRKCLDQLDDAKRGAILLAYVDGYSHSQIAARLAVPLGTIKAWIRRGLIALKGCLS